ncbi:MAG TPA: hypothetical protein GXX14_14390, partial [Clostridiaceae bacterium]|nr:hypothetical protein [Clostridiaceae bacterium]
EKTISNMCAICAGNDVVMNSGMFATGLTISLEQLILDDEINGIIRRLHRGIDVNEKTIGAEVIKRVGPRGNFIIEDHTFEFLRSGEFREVKVSNTKNYDNWISAGAPSVVENASKKAKEILKAGNDKKLDNKIIEKMSDIIKEFEKGLGK